MGRPVAQKIQHHRAAPDLANRVGDSLASDVGRRAVHRLEQRREQPLGIEVVTGGNADGAGSGRPQVA